MYCYYINKCNNESKQTDKLPLLYTIPSAIETFLLASKTPRVFSLSMERYRDSANPPITGMSKASIRALQNRKKNTTKVLLVVFNKYSVEILIENAM